MSANRTTPDEDGLEAYFELFGDRFRAATAAASSTTPRRPPRRRWAVGVLALACAAAIVLMSMLPGTAGTRAVDVVAQAQAALAPAGEIVHMTVTTTVSDGPSSVSRTAEQWSATHPERWRLVQTIEPSSTDTLRDRFGGVILGRVELSYDGGVLRRFLADQNILDVLRARDPQVAGIPGLLRGADPATELRAALDSGTVTDEGEQQIGGRTVRRIVTMRGTGRQARQFTFDVDPQTYAPVQAQLTTPEIPDVVYRFHVDSYERLTLTPRTARLLTIATNAATTVHNEKQP
jgi:hypothetical protein